MLGRRGKRERSGHSGLRALPGRGAGARSVAPGTVGGAVGEESLASHRHRPPRRGRGVKAGGVHANKPGTAANRGARRGSRPGGDPGRRPARRLASVPPGLLVAALRACDLRLQLLGLVTSSAAGRARPGPLEGQAAAASGRGGRAAGSGGRCLRWRSGRPSPLQRAPCIRSPPRPRATTVPSFPSAAAATPAAATGAAAAAGTGSPQGRRRRPPSPTRTGSARVTAR